MANVSTSARILIAVARAAVPAATIVSATALAPSPARGATFSARDPIAPLAAVISGSAASWSAVVNSST